jgi:hypothetical protein
MAARSAFRFAPVAAVVRECAELCNRNDDAVAIGA